MAKEGSHTARIRQLIEQLQQASYAMSQQTVAQQQAAEPQQAGGPWTGSTPYGGQEDVVDGEFSEA